MGNWSTVVYFNGVDLCMHVMDKYQEVYNKKVNAHIDGKLQ